ncbi:hypothetical protein, partial [Nitrosomonas sp.]|uniref:hypothetical protein n=1 Tax=Nitrosomonas sp. TaxID=42353 RepID=UPI001E084EB7
CAEEPIFYGVIPAAASLPDLEDEQRKRFIEHIPADSKQVLRNKIQPPAASLAAEQAFSPLNMEIFEQVIKAIKIHLTGEFNLAEFMKLVKRGFQAGLKFNRAFFAMPETQNGQTCLVSRFMFGNETGLQDLRIPVTGRNLFQRLLESPQAIHCKAGNRKAVLGLLPGNFRDVIQTDEFFVMTIRTSRKTLGIVYADRYGNDYGLDARDYEKFRQLCQLLAKGFERLGK